MKVKLKKKEEELCFSVIVGIFAMQCFLIVIAFIVMGMQFKMFSDVMQNQYPSTSIQVVEDLNDLQIHGCMH